jgi:hypothetical protein
LEQESDESNGGIDMKVNLTRLLESPTRTRQPKEKEDVVVNKTSALIVVTNYESTSSDRAYSFELEKEIFSLER